MCIFLKTYQTWWFCVVTLILTMDWKKQHLGILCFITSRKIRMKLKCKKKKICAVYVVGDFMLEDAPWLGWTVEVDSDQIETLIENNQYYTKGEIANILKIPKSSVENCLHKLRYVNRFDAWVPYKFSKKTFLTIFPLAILYWNVTKNVPFLKTVVRAMMWNGRDYGTSTMNHCQSYQSLVFIQRRWCAFGEIGSPLLRAPSRKPNN